MKLDSVWTAQPMEVKHTYGPLMNLIIYMKNSIKELRKRLGKTLWESMKNQIVEETHIKPFSKRIQNSGWIRVPAVSTYDHLVGEYNEILKSIGIKKRLPGKIEYTLSRLNRMNRYMEHQLRRMERIRSENPRLYWFIAWSLMRRSVSFRFSAIHKVLPTWYCTLHLNEVLKINRKITEIVNNWNDDLEFRRVYIPKGDTYRPLGVPTIEWRIVLHMWNNFIHYFMKDYFLPTQHGFLPGRGTLSAWREIINKVIHSKYIYECDLRQFFPSVNITKITDILLKEGVPKRVVYYIENINRNSPMLPDEKMLEEQNAEEKSKMRTWRKSSFELDPESSVKKAVEDFVKANGKEMVEFLAKEEGCESIEEYVQLQWALMDSFSPSPLGELFKGVPQGAPTSPVLSIMVLKEFLSEQRNKAGNLVNSVSYADDPIFYSEEDFEIKEDEYNGISLNSSKSSWVKRNGIWLKPLKYLGLTYLPESKELIGTPRNKEVITTPENLPELWGAINYSEKEDYVEEIVRTNMFGFIQSCLYSGNWNNTVHALTEEELKEKKLLIHSKSLLGQYAKTSSFSTLALSFLYKRFKPSMRTRKKSTIY